MLRMPMKLTNKVKRRNKKLGLTAYGTEWGCNSNYIEEPFLFDSKRPFYGKCGICKKETTDIPYVDNGTENILYSLIGQMDIVRYITRFVREDEITPIRYDKCDRYPYYYCWFCKANYLLCMNSPSSEHIDPISPCQTISSARHMDIPFFIDADDNVGEKIHDIFSNNESDKVRLEMFYDALKGDHGTFWKYRTGEFYPITMSSFATLEVQSAFYFIGECYTCHKVCTGTIFSKD
jgi:hypothetical protein